MIERVSPDGKTTYFDAGSGQPLVFLHGFPLSKAMWRPQIEAFSRSVRALAPDLPGFGRSQRLTGTPTVEGMADRVLEWLDALTVREPIVLAGLSMGGYVALAFARRHAARLRGLILADTKADPDDDAGKAARDNLIALANASGSTAVLEQMMPKMLSAGAVSKGAAVANEVRSIAGAQPVAGVVDALKAMRERPDAKPWLSAIAVPTLVVVGEEDALTPPSRSSELTNAIPGAEYMSMPGAGHMSNLEQPGAFNDVLGIFLQGPKFKTGTST